MTKFTKVCCVTRLKIVTEAYGNLITLFDVQAGHYKSVNLDTVTSIRCSDKVVWNEGM